MITPHPSKYKVLVAFSTFRIRKDGVLARRIKVNASACVLLLIILVICPTSPAVCKCNTATQSAALFGPVIPAEVEGFRPLDGWYFVMSETKRNVFPKHWERK